MVSTAFETFRQAIIERKRVCCVYRGRYREVCPHALGYAKDDNEQVLTFQFAGESSKGLSPGGEWRCFDLSRVSRITCHDGPWRTSSDYSGAHRCVARVVVEVDA